MTVHFIGAGPGAADLLTLRGANLIASCPIVLYAGSLVPDEVIGHASPAALVMDSAPMTLDEILAVIEQAHTEEKDVARVHSGDTSLYGAIGEQIRRLQALGIDYDITPGVPAFAAAAAVLGQELTLPDISQTVILTRTTMRSSAMPNQENLETLARSGATLAIHLSARNTRHVQDTLVPLYGADCPVAVVVRVTWPDEQVFRCRLDELHRLVKDEKIRRTALILVGRVLSAQDYSDSKLYDAGHFHVLRPKKKRVAAAR
jgi:precorrin-4/cobalt-precorrin-4 C11-methyltransferase